MSVSASASRSDRPPMFTREAHAMRSSIRRTGALVLALSLWIPSAGRAQAPETRPGQPAPKPWVLGLTPQELQAVYPEYFRVDDQGRVVPFAIPNIFTAGSGVLKVGKIAMKITNNGILGNPFTNLTSDPSGQWPGQSSIEYLNAMAIGVGAVNPTASDPNAVRRVSYSREWRQLSLEPEDDIFPAYDGITNGIRFSNDDGDFDNSYVPPKPKIDEDHLDGRDNDGDGRVDEDYAALGQEMWSCTMSDNTIEAINLAQAERHVPLGLEIRQRAWAYSLSQFENFNVIDYQIFNRSGHVLDSLVVGWLVDMDSGPFDNASYFNDDLDAPGFPSGAFTYQLLQTDARRQTSHDNRVPIPNGVPLCTELPIRVNGFSVVDDDGDMGRTPGVGSFLLFDHTIDLLGVSGPSQVGFRAFRSFTGGTPYTAGGIPTIDQQRFEFMTSRENVSQDPDDPLFGFISAEPGDQTGDYIQWVSVGPWLNFEHNQSISVTIGFAVQPGDLDAARDYRGDYQQYKAGILSQDALLQRYPVLRNAFDAQVAFEGIWETREGFDVTDCHGCETGIYVPITGQTQFIGPPPCDPEGPSTTIPPGQIAWFDFDCNYCTGIYDPTSGGLFHKIWNASSPPPNPRVNVSVGYNYTDNPERRFAPAGDNAVYLAWDNLSETSVDPSEKQEFDFRGYKVWKVSDWIRPVGAPGPKDSEWQLLGEFRKFDYLDNQKRPIASNRYLRFNPANPSVPDTVCPRIYIPQRGDSMDICLNLGDLWDRQSGTIIRPDESVPCVGAPAACEVDSGCVLGVLPCLRVGRTKYEVGRYQLVDREVKNGFIYFYAVTAFDSTRSGSGVITELEGRRSAVEAEGVVPQSGAQTGRNVWVVPNPYRGYRNLSERPSSWDLTPNATDPTGTHVDFMGLPSGNWTIRIYTISGDLVTELRSSDPVNESNRSPVTQPVGGPLPGYNRQQDTPNDGQARWNLISRNGQDVVSGVYLFTVDSSQGLQRGRFVIIR